ncbi:MAG: bifunctional glutamate--cysteine ligase GshA/glutathione synthetase GshB [Cellulosilyticaceae bacterium]
MIKQLYNKRGLMKGHFGIEREGLRCDAKGRLANTPHPKVFGEKLQNPYITTDFSESQLELITPAFASVQETHDFLTALYDIAALEIGDEYIWAQSMPCIIPEDEQIPVATYGDGPSGEQAHNYRKKLLAKYGGKKQLLSGIHYNFSFDEKLIEELYEAYGEGKSYKVYRDEIYLKVTRNYLRYRWLLIYLLGSTSVVHESYMKQCVTKLEPVDEESYTNQGALSYRNSECGYTNKVTLYPDYHSVEAYVRSIEQFMEEGWIESPNELYSQIRLKAYDKANQLASLSKEGIAYLEYRSIDSNPFDRAGIALDDLYFMKIFSLFLLCEEESSYDKWQEEALENQRSIARFGQGDVILLRDGEEIHKEAWGLQILRRMQNLDRELELGQSVVIEQMIAKLKDYKLTYAYRIMEEVKAKGYVNTHLELAKSYKEQAYRNRYRLKGYEDMELSTQLLMKEAIKRGIKVDLLDRSENFIALQKEDTIQYVKQATKTSKDNYVTVLMMENKTVTKEVLRRQGIKVPRGDSFDSKEAAFEVIDQFVNRPVVVKPKSTNFGVGISIFPGGSGEEDLKQAIAIAFEHDQTILIEEFVRGKEYRFLVIDDQVVGILHRVPANVIGDGVQAIKELVAVKNQDSLRGKGYKTPLEKIALDESAQLFLKQKGMTCDTIVGKDEVVYLRENSNISTGGDSIDYTDVIPDRYKQIAIQSAQAVGAKICGVDMMIEDFADGQTDYAIIELNFNPAIHIHCYPYKGVERNIAKEVLKLLGFLSAEIIHE